MKKLFLITLISAVLTAAVFAEPKTYAIDLGDSNIKKIEIVKNPYGVNHQCKAPAVFTNFFKNDIPSPGDTIELHYKFKSNVDIPGLVMAIIDNSEKANYWLPISNQYETIANITAGTVYEGVLIYKVVAKPVVDITVQLMYDDEINSIITLQKAGVKTGRK